MDYSAAVGAELFVNDHWQLAQELGATGVHLGQEDLLALGDAGRARLRASGMALGVSSHSLWELCRARTLSPRYIACGPVWPTLTKDMPWVPQGLDNLSWWRRAAGVPVTAIGGILDRARSRPRPAPAPTACASCAGWARIRGDPSHLRSRPGQPAAAIRCRPAAWPHPTLPPQR